MTHVLYSRLQYSGNSIVVDAERPDEEAVDTGQEYIDCFGEIYLAFSL